MDVLLLRFDAPLMSFGGVMVDQHGPTERFPGLSMLTGLFGNALGLHHGDAEALDNLQMRLEYAARWDVAPQPLLDYHTVDLGQPKMCKPGWTTRGVPEHRGGASSEGTTIRYRHYWADGVKSCTVTLLHTGLLTVTELAAALRTPARPLFIGRKTCLPAAPLLLGQTEATDVLTALQCLPRAQSPQRQLSTMPMEACWPAHLGVKAQGREVAHYDRRDWRNQIHAGRRIHIEGLIANPSATEEAGS